MGMKRDMYGIGRYVCVLVIPHQGIERREYQGIKIMNIVRYFFYPHLYIQVIDNFIKILHEIAKDKIMSLMVR